MVPLAILGVSLIVGGAFPLLHLRGAAGKGKSFPWFEHSQAVFELDVVLGLLEGVAAMFVKGSFSPSVLGELAQVLAVYQVLKKVQRLL